MERDPRTRAEEQKTYCLLPNKPYDALRVKLQVEYKGYARRSQTKLQRKFFQLQLEGTEYIYSANRFTVPRASLASAAMQSALRTTRRRSRRRRAWPMTTATSPDA